MKASEFSEQQISRMRSALAKQWKQSKDQVTDYEAIHYLRCERDGTNPESVAALSRSAKRRGK